MCIDKLVCTRLLGKVLKEMLIIERANPHSLKQIINIITYLALLDKVLQVIFSKYTQVDSRVVFFSISVFDNPSLISESSLLTMQWTTKRCRIYSDKILVK